MLATRNRKTERHNAVTDGRAITTDQICELINELQNLTSGQKQKLTAILMKHQGNFTKKPNKCRGFEYTYQVQGQIATVPALYHLHCDQWLARKYGN
jgi:hypothetical protein